MLLVMDMGVENATGNCDKKIYDENGPILGLMMGEQQAWKYLNLNKIKMKCMSCYERKASRDKKTGFSSLNCFQDVMDAGDWSILIRMYQVGVHKTHGGLA